MNYLERGWVRWSLAVILILGGAFAESIPHPWRIIAMSVIGFAMLGLAIVVMNRR